MSCWASASVRCVVAPQDQPGRPAGREGRGRRLRHDGQRLAPALASGWQALGLAQPAGIGRDTAIAPGIAPGLELPKQLHRGPAAGVPALEEIVFIGIEHAAAIAAAVLGHGPRRQPQIPLDGVPAVADLRGDGRDGPALAVQGPYRVIGGLALRRTLGGLLLGAWGRGWGWDGDRDRPIGERHRLLARRRIDGVQRGVLRREHLGQRFREILDEMKAVRDLGGRGGPLPRPVSVGARPIPRDHFDPRMRPEPLRQGVGGALGQERHGVVALLVHQDRAIGLPLPQGKIVHAQDGGGGTRRQRQPAEQAQQRIPADGHAELLAQQRARGPTQREGNRPEAVRQPLRPPRPGGQQLGQALGKDAARAAPIGAEKLADAELQHDAEVGPREVSDGPRIVAMDVLGGTLTDGAMDEGLRRGETQRQLGGSLVEWSKYSKQLFTYGS